MRARAGGQVCVEIREQVEELEKWAKQAQKFQQIFGSNLTRYPALDDLVSDISLKKGMWQARPVPATGNVWSQ